MDVDWCFVQVLSDIATLQHAAHVCACCYGKLYTFPENALQCTYIQVQVLVPRVQREGGGGGDGGHSVSQVTKYFRSEDSRAFEGAERKWHHVESHPLRTHRHTHTLRT